MRNLLINIKMDKLNKFLEGILYSNFNNSIIKYTYLYNELFISIYDKTGLVLFGVSYKSTKLLIVKYSWNESINWKILLVILKKYEDIFLKLLEWLNKDLFNIWEESEFINIYDKKELWFNDIKKKLEFSFLDDYGYRRKIQNEFKFEDKSILDIYHSDFECSKCHWPVEAFTSFPDFEDVNDYTFFENKYPDKRNDFLMTNINDYESITIWWNQKIDEILSNKKLLDEYDLISINKTCISVIMWDDIMSIYKYNNVDPKKIFYTDQNTDSPYRAVINYLSRIDLKKWEKSEKLLFFWLNKNKNTAELIKFLKENFNIEVGNVLLPNIDIKDLWEINNFKLAVYFSWRETKAQNIFKLYPINNLDSNIPYGLSKSFDLFSSILNKYNRESEIKILEWIIWKSKEINSNLFEKVKKFQIWFILNDFHIKQFINNNFRGVPILSLLNDMWFKINFFIFNTNELYTNDLEEFNKKNDFNNLNNFNTIISNDKSILDKFIDDENIQLYYSEINNDYRILDKNKGQFSISDFEYWIDWFYRTFELLVKKCERVVYYNNYIK